MPAPAGPRASLDLPLYGASPRDAVVRFWLKYAVFTGRASRSEYWWWALVNVLVSTLLQLVAAALSPRGFVSFFAESRILSLEGWLPLAWSAVALVPNLALGVRRLHDTNRSGWWLMLSMPSLAGSVLQMVALGGLNPDPAVIEADPLGTMTALLPALALSLVGVVGAVIIFAFTVSWPDPRGARFDRPGDARP